MFIRSIKLQNGSEMALYTGEVCAIRVKEKATEVDVKLTCPNGKGREEVTMTVPFVGPSKESVDKLNLKEGYHILFGTSLYNETEYGQKVWYSGDMYYPDQFITDNGMTKGIHIVKGYLYLNEYETGSGKRTSGAIKVKGYEKSDGTLIPDRYMNFQFSNIAEEGRKSQEEIARQLFKTEDGKGVEAVILASDANVYTDKNGVERESYNVISMHPMYSI